MRESEGRWIWDRSEERGGSGERRREGASAERFLNEHAESPHGQ